MNSLSGLNVRSTLLRRHLPQLIVASLMLASPAAAQRVIHRVRFGDTYAAIAQEYYGTPDAAGLIALLNGRDAKTTPRAGERIRVPTAWIYVVPRAMTVRALAKQLLGSARRDFALRQFNRLRGRRVQRNQEVLVPFILNHITTRGETLIDLAQRFYRDGRAAGLIGRYNGIQGAQPAPGTQLSIPIANVQIAPAKLRQLTNERLLGIGTNSDDRREAIQEANALLRRGEYWQVPLRLIRTLAQEHSSDDYIADVFKLMAIAYVALGQHELAVLAFREALLREPSLKLDAVRDSPKIIRAFLDAKSEPQK